MEIPKVNFIYAYPLDENRRTLYSKRNLGSYPSIKDIKEKISYWEKLWGKINENNKIILKLKELTKRVPERSLECFVIGSGMQPMSTPFIMPLLSKEEERSDIEFIDKMIHEIIHIFVSSASGYFNMVRDKYSKESVLTQNHIIIYALLQKIYLDILNSKPIDFDARDLSEEYDRAVKIVIKEGYQNLIDEYQKFV